MEENKLAKRDNKNNNQKDKGQKSEDKTANGKPRISTRLRCRTNPSHQQEPLLALEDDFLEPGVKRVLFNINKNQILMMDNFQFKNALPYSPDKKPGSGILKPSPLSSPVPVKPLGILKASPQTNQTNQTKPLAMPTSQKTSNVSHSHGHQNQNPKKKKKFHKHNRPNK